MCSGFLFKLFLHCCAAVDKILTDTSAVAELLVAFCGDSSDFLNAQPGVQLVLVLRRSFVDGSSPYG